MLKQIVKSAIRKIGYEVTIRSLPIPNPLFDIEEDFFVQFDRCQPYTMTTVERTFALYKAMEYTIRYDIPGDIVECGVWKGGSAMICALQLIRYGDTSRKIYLYDTYAGMPAPTEHDVRHDGYAAREKWLSRQHEDYNEWCYASLDEVKQNLATTNYPSENLVFVKGKVEDTMPGTIPEQIAVLRLDTDLHESTYHELVHLFPRLSQNGIIIVDDYGYWQGAQKACDQYFEENHISIFLSRIDNTGRIGIKTLERSE